MGIGVFVGHMLRRKATRECERCGLRYTIDNPICPHCDGLTDEEVVRLKSRLIKERFGNANMGRVMLMTAAILAAITIVMIVLF